MLIAVEPYESGKACCDYSDENDVYDIHVSVVVGLVHRCEPLQNVLPELRLNQ